jgi:hypothetical protein
VFVDDERDVGTRRCGVLFNGFLERRTSLDF